MKLRLEATPDELREKSAKLIERLHDELLELAPEAAETLEKALPPKEPGLKYPVLRELAQQTGDEYDRTIERMLKDIGKVLDRSPEVAKSEGVGLVFVQDPTDLSKGWVCGVCGAVSPAPRCEHVQAAQENLEKALYIGPRGGKWADPGHTIPWDPEKHGRQVGFALGPQPERQIPKPAPPPKEPDILDVVANDPILTDEQRDLPVSPELRAIGQSIARGEAAADPREWGLPAGARVNDPWEPKPIDPNQKWEHPDYGAGIGPAPWQEGSDWAPDFNEYDYILVNSSAGKDSQVTLAQVVKHADEQGVPRDRIIVVHCDLGRVDWRGTKSLAQQQAEHYGLRFEVVRREDFDLAEQVEIRHGDLVQREMDVALLAEAGIRTWRQLRNADPEDLLKIIGEGKGDSQRVGLYRANALIRQSKQKHDKVANTLELAKKSAEARIQKAELGILNSKSAKAKANAEQRRARAREDLQELNAQPDPWDYPINFGAAIAWPSANARYCTKDHKTVLVEKLTTALANEAKAARGDDRPTKVLNCLGIRAQESDERAKQPNFQRETETRNQVVDRWFPIYKWHEKRVWEAIQESGVPFHKAYALGMRRLSCVFCVYATKEDLMVAAIHNPELFLKYLEIEEKVGASFKKGLSLREVADEIKRRREEGFQLNELTEWVKKALGIDDTDLVKSSLGEPKPNLVGLILEAALARLGRHGQEIVAVTMEWKVSGACVHLDTTVDSHHATYLPYPDAYNASLLAATFAQRHGLEFEEHNAPAPLTDAELLQKSLYIGPRGGKWADPEHTIPWDPEKHGRQMAMPFGTKESRPKSLDEWLPGKPLMEAEEAIRKESIEHAVICGPDQRVAAHIEGTKHYCKFTPEILQTLEDQILTHNHPNNIVLSTDDLRLAVGRNLREMRAVGSRGTLYRITRPRDGWLPWGIGFDVFRHHLEVAKVEATDSASSRMDKHILDSGGIPGEDDPAFSQEVFDAWFSEEFIEKLNNLLAREEYEWRIEVDQVAKSEFAYLGGDAPGWGDLGQGLAAEIPAGWIELSEEAGESLWDALEKGGETRPHKYIRRVPYFVGGKRKYRYYYRESALTRAAREGEEIRLGDQVVRVLKVEASGDIVLENADPDPNKKVRVTERVKADEWASRLAGQFGDKFYEALEKRAYQAVGAVLRHVPRKLLADLPGDTDEARLEALRARVPEVYDKLQRAFQRAGVNPFEAKRILQNSLKRRGWDPEARATIIGNVLDLDGARLIRRSREVMDAAENLAGGAQVGPEHAQAAVGLAKSNITQVARRAEAELVRLNKALQAAQADPTDMGKKAAALATAVAAKAIEQLNALAVAFPGLVDRAVPVARGTMLQVPAVAPRALTRVGATASTFVAGEGGRPVALKTKYKLVEAGEIIPSHNPVTFAKNSEYPEDLQERAYHRDKAEQQKVIRNAKRMETAFVANTNVDAVNGPPIVMENGVVLGGNSRTMSMQRIYGDESMADKAEEMRQYLRGHAYEFGLTPEDVSALRNPILIREVEIEDKSEQNLQIMVRAMNESFIQAMDPRTMQVALGRRLPERALELLASSMTEDETLAEYLDTSRARPFIQALHHAGIIDERNQNQYMRKGRLNADGKVMVARILAGRVLDDADMLSDTPHNLIESIAKSVPYMIQAMSSGSGYDLRDTMRVALDAFNELKHFEGEGMLEFKLDKTLNDERLRKVLGNLMRAHRTDLAADHPVMGDPRAQAVLEVFIRRSGSVQMPAVFREFARLAAANPEGQQLLGGAADTRTPEEVFRLAIQAAIDREAREAAEKAAKKAEQERRKKEKEAQGPGLFASLSEVEQEALLQKALYIGPRGGKWADPQHTIPWDPEKHGGQVGFSFGKKSTPKAKKSSAKGVAQPKAGASPPALVEFPTEDRRPVEQQARGTTQAKAEVVEREDFLAWFGNWKAGEGSKVVDAQGEPAEQYGPKPVKVFHGTPVGGFRVFSREHDKGHNIYGPGFYFTADHEIALEYTNKDKDEALAAVTHIERPGGQKVQSIDSVLVEEILTKIGFVPKQPRTGKWSSLAGDYDHPSSPSSRNPNWAFNALQAISRASDETGRVNMDEFFHAFWNPIIDPENPYAFEALKKDPPAWGMVKFVETTLEALGLPPEAAKVPESQVFEVFLNIRNPLDMDREVRPEEIQDLALWKARQDRKSYERENERLRASIAKNQEFIQSMREELDILGRTEKNEGYFQQQEEFIGNSQNRIEYDQQHIERNEAYLANSDEENAKTAGMYGDDILSHGDRDAMAREFMTDPRNYDVPIRYDVLQWIKKRLITITSQTYTDHLGVEHPTLPGLRTSPPDVLTWTDAHYILSNVLQDKRFIREFAEEQGYDGIHHTGGWNVGTKNHDVWIAWESSQIKATNARRFDPTSPDIYNGDEEEELAASMPDGDLEKAKPLFIGPRGGKWADPQHKISWQPDEPQSTGSSHVESPQEPKEKVYWEVVNIEDTREYDWESGKPIPGSGVGAECERCKKIHDVIYTMRNPKTKEVRSVGSTCGPKLAGGGEFIQKKTLAEAKKKLGRVAFEKQKAKIAELAAEMAPQVAEWFPPGYVPTDAADFKAGKPWGIKTEDGLAYAEVRAKPGEVPTQMSKDIAISNLAIAWARAKAKALVSSRSDIPEKWAPVGKQYPALFPQTDVASALVSIMLRQWDTVDSPYSQASTRLHEEWAARRKAAGVVEKADQDELATYDFTKPIADRDERGYTRVKDVLKRMGYQEGDFEESGPFWGWSVNELIDFARDKRGD